jgi:hypothetical protein
MRISNRCGTRALTLITAIFLLAFLLPFGLSKAFAQPAQLDLSTAEKHRLGERLYRQGILPSGGLLKTVLKGDSAAPGTSFSCVVCHLRSGIGSFQEGVYTPPINGEKLFQPLQWLYKGLEQSNKYSPAPIRRPAYTEETLATVIRQGIDPSGRTVSEVMPRYRLADEDMAVLISYLRSLSSTASPGVSADNLVFATIVSDRVPAAERDALLVPLDNYVRIKNTQAQVYKQPIDKSRQAARSRQMAENMLASKELATRTLTLARWVLKGPPETWRRQLDEFYRREPVFAFLGGVTTASWEPIHQFCEENQIPCLLPDTDLPIIAENGSYTLYPSKGYYQEGETAARFIAGRADAGGRGRILMIVRGSPAGKALSAGFAETWRELGQPPPVTVMLNPKEEVTGTILQNWLAREKPAAMILWDGPEALPWLETLAVAKNRPTMAVVSARLLGGSLPTLPEQARDFTYITYPFMLDQKVTLLGMGNVSVRDEDKVSARLAKTVVQDRAQKIRNLANSITQILTMALMEMKGRYYRDNFLDVINLLPDQVSPEFGKLSFSPGNAFASNGAYIVQLTQGPNPDLVRRSAWVIH